jgi:hypothetical protein
MLIEEIVVRVENVKSLPVAPPSWSGPLGPTHTEVSSRFAESRGRGMLFTTVVVCFDEASEVM